MNYTTYIGTAPQLDGSLVWKYDVEGILRVFENHSNITDEALLKFMARHAPMVENWHSFVVKQFKDEKAIRLHIERIAIDLSFEAFWTFYDKKVGNKKRAQEIWDGIKPTQTYKMTEADQVRTFKMLPRMKADYTRTKKEMPFAETFLNQRRFENEF